MKKGCAPGLSSPTDLVLCGRIGKAHGLDGTVAVLSESDDPARFVAGSDLVLADGTFLRIRSSRAADSHFLVRFDGVSDRNGAESLSGQTLYVTSDRRRSLGPDEYWPDELIGMRVVDDLEGSVVGTVVDYIEGSAQDRLVIEGVEVFEVPFVQALVPGVDIDLRVIRIARIDGLIPGL